MVGKDEPGRTHFLCRTGFAPAPSRRPDEKERRKGGGRRKPADAFLAVRNDDERRGNGSERGAAVPADLKETSPAARGFLRNACGLGMEDGGAAADERDGKENQRERS